MYGVNINSFCSRAWEAVEKDGMLVRYDARKASVSALYTWQDNRCKKDFLDTLPAPESHLKCFSGYGCATLLWLARNKPEKLALFNRAGTIQDFVVAMMCNLDVPLMTTQNAASWGYFDTTSNTWNIDILEREKFPVNLLPKIVESGQIGGTLQETWYGIPQGTPVGAALGDLQCSFLATLETSNDAVLNISTSAQLGFVVDEISEIGTLEYLPYFNGKYLAVAASLNGGNTMATFVKMLQQWVMDLGFAVPQSKVWEKLITLGKDENASSSIIVHPLLLGERHSPEKYASVTNINLSNLSLGQVFKGLCEGLIANINSMMPREILINANITRILGNGSGLSRNVVLQKAVETCYNLPLVFTSGGDAAKGAAISML